LLSGEAVAWDWGSRMLRSGEAGAWAGGSGGCGKRNRGQM
jgi:hypothetical protein